jgi:hypothetical protein
MATAKTGSFYLTEAVTLAAAAADGSRAQGVIDLGAYVNVPTGQAVAIENVEAMLAGNGALSMQLSDLNPGTVFIRADDQSLIASGALNIDIANNIGSQFSDLYPDNFGPGSLSEAFMVVNDSLYLVAGVDGAAIGGASVHCTARIKCRVVKLSKQDWMAIAIQSTASDN